MATSGEMVNLVADIIMEPWWSGLTYLFAKEAGPLKASRVRIPPSPQIRESHKIVRKRRKPNTKWRAGRNSPLKPPFRPARIFVGRFGNCGDKCKRRAGRKNEGAVADERVRTDFLEKRSDLGCISAVY